MTVIPSDFVSNSYNIILRLVSLFGLENDPVSWIALAVFRREAAKSSSDVLLLSDPQDLVVTGHCHSPIKHATYS